uniref:ABC transporter domain-containing protein n=1 Tax=Strongyloides stercoralis TaxID=6248 RepID=A0A0K0DSK3_STRER
MTNTNDFYFDIKFFKSLIYLSSHFYSPTNYYSIILTLLILLISISSEILGYYLGLVPGQCYKTLMNKDSKSFFYIFWKGSLMYIGKCALLGALTTSGWFLYIVYRSNITKILHKKYFKNNTLLKVNLNYDNNIDNPDQRITQDVDKMCNQLANSIMPAALICPLVIGYYTYKTYETAGFYGIGAIYLYFILGTIVNRFIVSPLAKWTGRVEKYEGDLRYKHTTIKNNCEQINFYKAQSFENEASDDFLYKLLKHHYYLSWWRFPNSFWQNFFNYYGGFMSYAIQYIPVFVMNSFDDLKPSDFAQVIANNAFIYIYLINSFTRLTDTAYIAGQMAGVLQRVSQLLKYMEEINEEGAICNTTNDTSIDDALIINNLVISKPQGGILINKLNINLKDSDSLLIFGNSGVGKTSLLRVIANIWSYDSGEVICKYSDSELAIIPQKPYFPTGKLTLMQQLIFPKKLLDINISITDFESKVLDLLSMLKLNDLFKRIGSLFIQPQFEYVDLTPGELQRLSIIRGLLRDPKILLLDESTSSISEEMEEILYEYLLKNSITLISIGHRKSLSKWHNHTLTLCYDGSYIYT